MWMKKHQKEKWMGKLAVITGNIIFLSLCTVQDVKTKTISNKVLSLWAVSSLCLLALSRSISLGQMIAGLSVGLLLLVFSLLSREQIGKGDALVFCILGMGHGMYVNVAILLLSLFFSAVTAVVLLVCAKVGRKEQIAFLPFILTAYVLFLTAGH